MQLLLDIGNTRIKWGVAADGRITPGAPFSSRPEGLEQNLSRAFASLPAPRRVIACNVAGDEVAAGIHRWLARRWSATLETVWPMAEGYGVKNAYPHPEKLGADRWISLIALRHHYALPACVADCGTAVTIDVLDKNGGHLGGVIVPGLALMRQILLEKTRGIREIGERYEELLGKDTASAVQSGTLQAVAGLIERVVSGCAVRLGDQPTLVVTGGDAGSLASRLGIPYHMAPDLILQGLLVIAEDAA